MNIFAKIGNFYIVIASIVLLFICVMHPDVNGDAAGAGGFASVALCLLGISNLTYYRKE